MTMRLSLSLRSSRWKRRDQHDDHHHHHQKTTRENNTPRLAKKKLSKAHLLYRAPGGPKPNHFFFMRRFEASSSLSQKCLNDANKNTRKIDARSEKSGVVANATFATFDKCSSILENARVTFMRALFFLSRRR